jgi:CRP-like cAMP-binding protein
LNTAAEPVHNRLLATLKPADFEMLRPSLERVDLEARQVLETPRQPISDVYFVQSGLVSVVGTTHPDHRIEVGMVGHEGMTGLGIVLGDDRSANETLVQSAGSALRISAAALRSAMQQSPGLTTLLLRYAHVFLLQGSQTALANGRGKLDERLARWLLMWHDRLGSDDLVITHEFLALLLGVRRQGVTETLHTLEGAGLIRSSRSLIKILDRDGLHTAANGFYGVPEAEYDRSIGLLVRPTA